MVYSQLADLSTVSLNDISVGGYGSFAAVATPTCGQRKAFELSCVDPAKMFPAADRLESANRLTAKGKLRFCGMKFRWMHAAFHYINLRIGICGGLGTPPPHKL